MAIVSRMISGAEKKRARSFCTVDTHYCKLRWIVSGPVTLSHMQPRRDTLSRRLRDGATLFGTFIELPCAESVEIAALAGWDYCIIDGEHSAIGIDRYPDLVRAGDSRAMPTLVRVPENRPAPIQHALDSGAAGVLIPQVGSYDEAVAAVSASRFHPLGCRGVNGFVRSAGFSARPTAEYLADSNGEILCAVQLESAAACRDAERIATIAGLDVLFVGPFDLSQSLGVPGLTSHPEVVSAIQNVAACCAKHRVAAGIYANTPEDARRWADTGFRFVTCLVDTVVLLHGMRTLRASLFPQTS